MVTIQKEIKTSNVVAVFLSFLTPIIVSLIAKQQISVESFVYSLINGVGGLFLTAIGTTVGLIKQALNIILDVKMTNEEKLAAIQKILVQLMQSWNITWEKVKGLFVSAAIPATPATISKATPATETAPVITSAKSPPATEA